MKTRKIYLNIRINNKLTLYTTVLILFINCTNNSVREQNLPDTQSPKHLEIDRNLFKTTQDYLDTKLTFDIENSSLYMHPISWELLKLKLPEEKDINSIKKRIKEIYQTEKIEELNREFNMKLEVGHIIDSLSFNKENIYIIDYIRHGENKYDKIYEKNLLIAITKDMGETWKFFGIDPEYLIQIENLLSNYYPDHIVDKILYNIEKELSLSVPKNKFNPVDNKENNLHKQFLDYMDAFYKGDINKAISYIYPGVFIHLKDVFQNEYSLGEIKSIFKESSIDAIRKQIGNQELYTDISKILNKVEYESDYIFIISYSMKIGDKNDQISAGGETIAVSMDKGNNWTFFEKDDESVIPILSTHYPNQVITRVLNYEYKK